MPDAKSVIRETAQKADWDGPTIQDVLFDYIDSLDDLEQFREYVEARAASEVETVA